MSERYWKGRGVGEKGELQKRLTVERGESNVRRTAFTSSLRVSQSNSRDGARQDSQGEKSLPGAVRE